MGKKIKKYKVGVDSETYAISMVERPAIEEDFVALSKEDEEKVFFESDEKHIVYGAVLVPDKEIYRNNEKYGEYIVSFSNESVEKMSQDFMKNYRQYEVKTDHKNIANEVCVVESWLKSDLYKDKSVALGLNPNLPVGTWFCGMKVNNIDTWKRIKSGELKGFSVESALKLEEAFELNDNNMTINETNEMGFWNKMKEVLAEAFGKKEEEVQQTEPNVIESTNIDLEEQTPPTPEPVVETPQEQPKVEEPVTVPQEPKETAVEPENKPQDAPKQDDKHLEELVNSLKEEIAALKDMNNGLQDKIKDLGKQPSAAPINTNAKPSAADTYSAWREKMRSML
jgi:hypothetical protein